MVIISYLAIFLQQVVLFSTDSVPMKKNGKNQDGSGTNVLGRANAWSENADPEGRQAK